MRGFIRVRFGKIRSSVSTVASKLFHSVLFRIIMALVTLSLSAPIFEELRKIIEQILIDLNIAN
jgi:hypothetical protein